MPGTSINLGPRLLALLHLLCVNGAVVLWGLRSFATHISPVLPTVTVREGLVAGAVFTGLMVVHEAAPAAVVAGLGGTALRFGKAGGPHVRHGYDLVERFKALGVTDGDSDGVYRRLRRRLPDAAVDGARRPGAVGLDTGPTRRTYRISATGLRRLARLDAAAGELQRPSSVGVARPPGRLRQARRDIYQRF